MGMNFKINIMTEIKIKTVKELHKLKVLVEANNLDKPNFSELARQFGIVEELQKNIMKVI